MEASSRPGLARSRSSTLTPAAALAVAAPIVVLVLAGIVRLVALSSQPGGLYPDEGAEALDAHRLLHEPGFHPVFFEDDAGREAMYGYMVAAAFRVAGESVLVLRGASAVLGVLGVLAIYLALRRLGRGAALAGMAWSAGSLWLICISRDGMRNVTVPVFGALALWALLRWGDRPSRQTALVAGAAVGAGLWTYQPLKLTPLLLVLWLAWLAWRERSRFLAMRQGLAWFALAFVVVAGPMLVTAAVNPGGYFGRAVGVSPLNPVNTQISLVEHTLRTLGMFAITGDPNARHDVGALPLLGWPLFALALAGAWRAWRLRADSAHVLLLLGIPVFLLPPLVGVDGGSPHFLRSLGLAPFLAGLIGLGAAEVVSRAASLTRRQWMAPAAAAAVGALLLALGAGSANAYFSRPVADRFQAYNFDLVQLADAAALPDSAVIVDDYSAIDVRFLDATRLPAIYAPGARIDNPGRYRQVVAPRKQDIADALGGGAADRAVISGRDPAGSPTVWSVVP